MFHAKLTPEEMNLSRSEINQQLLIALQYSLTHKEALKIFEEIRRHEQHTLLAEVTREKKKRVRW